MLDPLFLLEDRDHYDNDFSILDIHFFKFKQTKHKQASAPYFGIERRRLGRYAQTRQSFRCSLKIAVYIHQHGRLVDALAHMLSDNVAF